MNNIEFTFHEYLRYFYLRNKGKIRRNYKELSRKFLDYNDPDENPEAYLRRPQFEALEMYIFLKEFTDNSQIYDLFKNWDKRQDFFSLDSYYSIDTDTHYVDEKTGYEIVEKLDFYDVKGNIVRDYYNELEKVKTDYPNYIYALTMGLGKTVLMATCIFYEFLLSNKYPKDKRYCQNALVFAPDKTVLQSLREIMTMDKSKVVPKEYINVLDTNMKFHFLDDTNTILSTIDGSKFNIVISNNQKIIVKQKRKEEKPAEKLFESFGKSSSFMSEAIADIYGDEDIQSEGDLMINQRFLKLCRLPQMGVYVDEAHHMFGNKLKDDLYKENSATSLRNTISLLARQLELQGTKLVACYNYTGTPYVKTKILPEVVYSYGLSESISNGYLKRAERFGFENVKNEEFLKSVLRDFFNKYSGKTYEGLLPKLAIFSSTIKELENDVKPIVEETLIELGIDINKILVNVGDTKLTKAEDIRDFNNLDVLGTEGSKKQIILLVDKGTEGWNCRSLFGVALFRKPKSKVFVLQSTMRCLRKITEEQQSASIYLSKENMDILEEELENNFRASLDDLGSKEDENKERYEVRVVPPLRKVKLNKLKYDYELIEKNADGRINFNLESIDLDKYKSTLYYQGSMTLDTTVKKTNIDGSKMNINYTELILVAEIARYLNMSPIKIEKLLRNSIDGIDSILEYVNKYNELLYDYIIPEIFKYYYEVKTNIKSWNREVTLLREPENQEYYLFKSSPEMVKQMNDIELKDYKHKSFHADTYCFDSKPEKECFYQYITSDNVEEVYFTGMFTGNQGDFSIQYYDPESSRIRNYYPDFLAKMKDGTYEIIEVKADHMINNETVLAKSQATKDIAGESNMIYKIYPSSKIMKENILGEDINFKTDEEK